MIDLTPMFEPRGVVVAGVSSHPGKFGFVALHNLLACGYEGAVFAVGSGRGEVLGQPLLTTIDDVPAGAADLCFVCTPRSAGLDVIQACARRGVRAAFVASAGYAEVGAEGARGQAELVDAARSNGILLAGPNGQGLVSTPVSLCAQIVAPYPPAGRIGLVSQSGNLLSSFLNLTRASGVGVSRAVSAGNAAALAVADYLDYFADDAATSVSLTYLESSPDGRRLLEVARRTTDRQPLVVLHGGATVGGRRAAASHTGALASDARVFAGMCRQAGATLVGSVEEAFDAAATFATTPLPRGPNVVVLTTVGGWGVLAADAVAASSLTLLELPPDLLGELDARLSSRWSRNNPIDLAGSEDRDTVVEVLELVAAHPAVDAILFLGAGIQSNEARMMREARFFPKYGLDRIVGFHERQDARYADAADAVSTATGKPVVVASELSIVDPGNPFPRTVRADGRYCVPTATRAVAALDHLWLYARHRARIDHRGATAEQHS